MQQDPIVIFPELGPEPTGPRPLTNKPFKVCVPCHTTVPRPASPKSIVEDGITRELFKRNIFLTRTKEWMRRTLGGYSVDESIK